MRWWDEIYNAMFKLHIVLDIGASHLKYSEKWLKTTFDSHTDSLLTRFSQTGRLWGVRSVTDEISAHRPSRTAVQQWTEYNIQTRPRFPLPDNQNSVWIKTENCTIPSQNLQPSSAYVIWIYTIYIRKLCMVETIIFHYVSRCPDGCPVPTSAFLSLCTIDLTECREIYIPHLYSTPHMRGPRGNFTIVICCRK